MKIKTSIVCFLAVCCLFTKLEATETPDKGRVDATVSSPGEVELSFQLRYNYPQRTSGKVSVLVSTDFNGNRESFEDIKAATWTDITDRCHIDYESNAFAPSGKVNLTDLKKEGKPIYVAFKYAFDPSSGNRQGAIVWVRNVQVQVKTESGVEKLSSTLSEDFLKHSTGDANKNPIRSENRGTSLVILDNQAHQAEVNGVKYTNKTRTEEYFVSVPYQVSKSK